MSWNQQLPHKRPTGHAWSAVEEDSEGQQKQQRPQSAGGQKSIDVWEIGGWEKLKCPAVLRALKDLNFDYMTEGMLHQPNFRNWSLIQCLGLSDLGCCLQTFP